jgi:formyltetrahydrofolate deformylase
VDSPAYTVIPGVRRWSGPTPAHEGPIIEQDVARVGHSHTPEQLVAIGRDVERLVLARAVRLYAEDRVVLAGARTVVFG